MARNRITGRETQKMQEYTQGQISQAERRGIEFPTDVKEQLFEYANLIGEEEAEEKLLRECGVDEATIEQIRMADRADFNSNRRFYRWTNDVAEYLEDMAGRERQAEVGTVAELLEEIESENLYQVLVTVDGRTLKIVLLKMQGYSTKEIAPLVHLTTGAIYARLDHLRKKLRKIL